MKKGIFFNDYKRDLKNNGDTCENLIVNDSEEKVEFEISQNKKEELKKKIFWKKFKWWLVLIVTIIIMLALALAVFSNQ